MSTENEEQHPIEEPILGEDVFEPAPEREPAYIYEYDSMGVYTGNKREIKPKQGCPPKWTRKAPPELQGEEVAIYDGVKWFKRDKRPVLPVDKKALLAGIEAQRKEAEAVGVTINDIRYSGDPDNRNALKEALDFAKVAGVTMFTQWKDSNGNFHTELPVAEVEQALIAIGARRSALIGLEGQYAAQVEAGTLTSTDGLTWEVDPVVPTPSA